MLRFVLDLASQYYTNKDQLRVSFTDCLINHEKDSNQTFESKGFVCCCVFEEYGSLLEQRQ